MLAGLGIGVKKLSAGAATWTPVDGSGRAILTEILFDLWSIAGVGLGFGFNCIPQPQKVLVASS